MGRGRVYQTRKRKWPATGPLRSSPRSLAASTAATAVSRVARRCHGWLTRSRQGGFGVAARTARQSEEDEERERRDLSAWTRKPELLQRRRSPALELRDYCNRDSEGLNLGSPANDVAAYHLHGRLWKHASDRELLIL